MSQDELRCWNCGESLKAVPRPISRHEQCPKCFEALHCCRLCRHFRTDITGSCDEERADPPVVKENANFCDWFRPSNRAFAGGRVDKRATAEDRLRSLFGEDAPETDDEAADEATDRPLSGEDQVRSKLDDLFSKD